MAVLIWTAVPVEHCTSKMRAFRRTSDPIRVDNDSTRTLEGLPIEGLPINDAPENPTFRHWQAGGVVVFGYRSATLAREAQEILANVYLARSGRVAFRRRW
jgi:hypothetical protein